MDVAFRNDMSSRERLLASLNHQEPDRVPMTFWGNVVPLHRLWQTPFERVRRLRELGVDDQMNLGAPWPYHPEVEVRVWRDDSHADYPRLVKELHTPKGILRMAVKKTPDYPWDDPPLVADHNWSRATEFLVKGPEDLDKLRYILYDPTRADLKRFREEAVRIKQFCRVEHVLVTAPAASLSNVGMGFVGAQNAMVQSVDRPDFLEELLDLILVWSQRQLEVTLALGVDTVQYSGIYASTAFWSPKDFSRFFAPAVRQIADMVRQAGAKFHYFSDARIMDRLETFRDLGVDALSYLNPPPLGDADLGRAKRLVGDRVCLWGGIGSPVTIEQGTPDDVRDAVVRAIRNAAPGGGFILAPADAILRERSYDNVMTMIRTCHEFGRYPIIC